MGLGRPIPEARSECTALPFHSFGSVGLGADVLDAQVPASVAEGECLAATPVVGHDASDSDAEAKKPQPP